VARGRGGSGNSGNSGNRGAGTRGRTFRVIGAKKRKPGRPRKARRALTAGALGLPPGLRTPAPVSEPVDDIENLRVERRTEESKSK
jgi:hypothetical protein